MKSARGFTLIEAVIATVIVAVMLTAALQTVAVSARTQGKSSDASRGAALADGLMAEIMAQSYVDSGSTPLFGHEAGETTANRSGCNDVDDYNGWTESPPQNKDGTTISNYANWTRSVVVAWVSTTDLTATSGTETKAKRIIVTVKHNGIPAATRTAVRTNAP